MEKLPIKLEPIVEQIKAFVPKVEAGRDKAVAAMSRITTISNDAELNEVNDLLVAVRSTYDGIYERRKQITEPIDQLKQQLMQYEKDIDANGKDTEPARLRKLISDYNQKKIDERKRIEDEARKQKDTENAKVDLVARMKKNLADLVIERVRQVQDGSSSYFRETTIETFEDRMVQFKKFSSNPKLKRDQYENCFNVDYNRNYINDESFKWLVTELQAEETYDKWNENVRKEIVPKLNDWIGRIPELKQQLLDKEKAKESAEKLAQIEAEQKRKRDEEDRLRKEEIEKMQRTSDDNIQQAAQVDKLQNDFREQAITQQVEDVGPVKLILKFNDAKPVKALSEMMYHCFSHPKFPEIQKKDKNKMPMVDEHGFPVYVDWVDSIVSFFVKYCDVNIGGVEIKEVPKVIVRK